MRSPRPVGREARKHGLQDLAPTLLGRVTIVQSDEARQRSQEDLARRRLALDQARHRWLLQVRRIGQQAGGHHHGSLLEQARDHTQHTGPPPIAEAGFLWGMRRVGTADHPDGAIPVCFHHHWEIRSGGSGLRCSRCSLTTSRIM